MHILIPHAGASGPQCAAATHTLALPHLRALLGLLSKGPRMVVEAGALSPPAERVRAQHLGLPLRDGLLPWAAWAAQQQGLPQACTTGWAYLTLCHWRINADHVHMQDPATLQVDAQEAETIMAAMQSYFVQDGITLHPHAAGPAGQWLASGDVFAELPTASLQRVIGGPVDLWLARQAQAKVLRRLQNEMQMLLYTHPVNDARTARGLPAINAFWVSATGSLPHPLPAHSSPLHQLDDLQAAALADDASAWVAAWQAVDSGPLADLLHQARSGSPVQLTLCTRTVAHSFVPTPQAWWTRLRRRWVQPDLPALLQNL